MQSCAQTEPLRIIQFARFQAVFLTREKYDRTEDMRGGVIEDIAVGSVVVVEAHVVEVPFPTSPCLRYQRHFELISVTKFEGLTGNL